MHRLAKATAVMLGLWVAIAGTAAAQSGPGRIYNDFARDGVLKCRYSKPELRAVLNDASLYQYGDPVRLNRLKLAIQRQLGGACASIVDDSSGVTQGWIVVIGSVLLLLTLGSGGWAARRALQTRR
jgi:hypothetical protein